MNGNEKKLLLSSLHGPCKYCLFECWTLTGPRVSIHLHSRISGQRASGYYCELEERKRAVTLKLLGLFKKQTNATSRERWISSFLMETTSACLASLFVLPFAYVFHMKSCCSFIPWTLQPARLPVLQAAGLDPHTSVQPLWHKHWPLRRSRLQYSWSPGQRWFPLSSAT